MLVFFRYLLVLKANFAQKWANFAKFLGKKAYTNNKENNQTNTKAFNQDKTNKQFLTKNNKVRLFLYDHESLQVELDRQHKEQLKYLARYNTTYYNNAKLSRKKWRFF